MDTTASTTLSLPTEQPLPKVAARPSFAPAVTEQLTAAGAAIEHDWVSIVRRHDLRAIFGLPRHVLPVAYLCLGWVREFLPEPELQRVGWAQRDPLVTHVHWENYSEATTLAQSATRPSNQTPLSSSPTPTPPP